MCGIFLFFYSRFLVGGRLLLGFCYRTFFCGFPWGLCHARNFFKDITHSYCGYVIPWRTYTTPGIVLILYLYYPLCLYLPLPVFVPVCVCVTPVFYTVLHVMLRLLVLVVCRVLHSVLGAGI